MLLANFTPVGRLIPASLRLLASLIVTFATAAAATPLQTFDAAFALPVCEAADLAPDGKLLAYLLRDDSGVTVHVMEIETATEKAGVLISKDRLAGGSGTQVRWISPQRFLVQLGSHGIVALDADGKNVTWIVDWNKNQWYASLPGPAWSMGIPPYDRYNPSPAVHGYEPTVHSRVPRALMCA